MASSSSERPGRARLAAHDDECAREPAPPRIPGRGRPLASRGALDNPDGRFERLARAPVDDGWETLADEPERLPTEVGIDRSRSVISYNDSPDIPFDRSVNPYRGCEHGCIYCYARPTHGWLGLSAGVDFERKLFHKPEIASLLAAELARPDYRPALVSVGAVTDPYQPLERKLGATRAVLEVLAACRHPLRIVTRGALVERDLDLLGPLAEAGLASVSVSLTTLDKGLAGRMEPRAPPPERRLLTIERLSATGVPVQVQFAPVIPCINEHELEQVLGAARERGAVSADYTLLRLPHELAGLFRGWLEAHFPERAAHVFARIRDARGGRDYDADFATRMRGSGVFAELLGRRFELARRRLGFAERLRHRDDCFDPAGLAPFLRPNAADRAQLELF